MLDCDGASLREAVRARPFLVKPNEHELESYCGRRLMTEPMLLDAARKLSRLTAGWVLLSRGKAGALLVNDRERTAWLARAPRIRVLNTVGAGDAMLAAVAAQIHAGASPADWLRQGVAAGTVLAGRPAGELPPAAAVSNLAPSLAVRRRHWDNS